MTPYYQDGTVTLYHGDCRDVLPSLTGVDLVFTSPPYNMGTSTGGGFGKGSLAAQDMTLGYDVYGDALPAVQYHQRQRRIVLQCWRTLSDNGALFYNHKPRIQDGIAFLPTHYGSGLPLRQVIIWDRGTGMNFSEGFFLPKCEWLMVWAKPDWKLVDRKASEHGDVWRIRPETNDSHPAPFPLGLPTRAISSTNAALVLDPFAGSGTTLRAAKNLGRKAIGIEISERYCEVAAERLSQEVLDLAV